MSLDEDRVSNPTNFETLLRSEHFWKDRYNWLLENGYQLRGRYAPNWVPSWRNNGKDKFRCEDGHPIARLQIIDATHLPTGSPVVLKLLYKNINPFEEDIIRYFCSEETKEDKRNHCVPLLDVLHPPIAENQAEFVFLVMPHLRTFRLPIFDTVGEAVDCIRQMLEGLQFMHEHHTAHRDLNVHNFMMDCSMFPEGFHPIKIEMKRDFSGPAKYLTRTQCPPRYYIIDFGLSRQYDANNKAPLEDIIIGGDPTVPEFRNTLEPQNPFQTDIYYAGNLIREGFLDGHPIATFIHGYKGLDFLRPLVMEMTQEDPSKRPTINEVVEKFDALVHGLSTWKLRSRTSSRRANIFRDFNHLLSHWRRKAAYVITHTPSIPSTARSTMS